MRLHRERVLKSANGEVRTKDSEKAGNRLRAVAAILLTLTSCMPSSFAQEPVVGAGSKGPDKEASTLPTAPTPITTQVLHTSGQDFSKAYANFAGNPLNMYKPTSIPKASFTNSVRLADLVRNGSIYLSLADAIAL